MRTWSFPDETVLTGGVCLPPSQEGSHVAPEESELTKDVTVFAVSGSILPWRVIWCVCSVAVTGIAPKASADTGVAGNRPTLLTTPCFFLSGCLILTAKRSVYRMPLL